MSFFSSVSYKPQAQIRQEGFHLPDSSHSPPSTPPPSSANQNSFDIFNPFLSDYRKFPSAGEPANSMDFGDELASLMVQQQHSNERSTHSPQPNINGAQTASAPSPGVDANAAGSTSTAGYDDGYHAHRPQTHNIFDISASTNLASSSATADSYNSQTPQPSAPNFNSTLPALNSSMRYDPHPDPNNNNNNGNTNGGPNHPPSSFHPSFTRHTPSPSSPFPPNPQHAHTHSQSSQRSRSRSRPPSGSGVTTGGVGPARTTRSRRNNSISGTSPPPPRPHAIVIPRTRANTVASSASAGAGGVSPLGGANTGATGGWFVPGHSSTSEYSLPTPDSITSHSHSHTHSHSYSHSFSQHQQSQQSQQQYTPFSLSSPTLPPVSAIHTLPLPMHSQHHQHPGAHPHSPHSPHTTHGFGSLGPGRGEPFGAGTPHSLPNVPNVPTVPSMHAHHGHAHAHGHAHGHGHGHGHGSPTVPSMGSPSISSPLGVGVTMPSISGVGVVSGLSVQDKQAALANEKRRRRRESHNAVERRRRDNINEKISELATLIPECMLDVPGGPGTGKNGEGKEGGANGKSGGGDCTPTEDGPQSPLDVWVPKKEDGVVVGAPGTSPPSASEGVEQGQGGKGASTEGGVVKANKGMILRKSVEYIRYLQQLVAAQGARNRELELELKQYREGLSPASHKDDEMGISGMDMMGMGIMMQNDGFLNGNGSAAHGGGGTVNGSGYGTLFGLPSMPEGEGEGEEGEGGNGSVGGSGSGEGDGMDVEGMSLSPEAEREEESMSGEERERERERERDRGRTRGRDAVMKGKVVGRNPKKLKDEGMNGSVQEDMMVM